MYSSFTEQILANISLDWTINKDIVVIKCGRFFAQINIIQQVLDAGYASGRSQSQIFSYASPKGRKTKTSVKDIAMNMIQMMAS